MEKLLEFDIDKGDLKLFFEDVFSLVLNASWLNWSLLLVVFVGIIETPFVIIWHLFQDELHTYRILLYWAILLWRTNWKRDTSCLYLYYNYILMIVITSFARKTDCRYISKFCERNKNNYVYIYNYIYIINLGIRDMYI